MLEHSHKRSNRAKTRPSIQLDHFLTSGTRLVNIAPLQRREWLALYFEPCISFYRYSENQIGIEMYGDLGTKLVRDAQRIQNLPQIPAYAGDLVACLVREVQALEQANDGLLFDFTSPCVPSHRKSMTDNDGREDETFEDSTFDPIHQPGVACALLVNHLAIRRNKRCLLAYHRVRTARIEDACWAGSDVGGPGGAATLPPGFGMGSIQIDASSARLTERVPTAAEQDRTNSLCVENLSPEEINYAKRFADLLTAYKGPFTDVDLMGSLKPARDLFIDVRVMEDAGAVETEYGTINLTKNSQFFVRQADVEQLLQLGYLQRLD